MSKSKRMRLPNGFGQISKLSGRLRKPYRAMVTVGFTDEGKPICKILKPVGYFETYNEAYSALLENQKSPYDKSKDMTVNQVYEAWSEQKYQDLSKGTVKVYRNNWKHVSDKYGDIAFGSLKTADWENIIEQLDLSSSGKMIVTNVLSGLYDYALRHEIVSTDYSKLIRLSKSSKYTVISGHHAFTEDELRIFWQNISRKDVQLVLIQIYTGMRPSELTELDKSKINISQQYMIGGIKTEAGKDRTIPIHSCIKQFVEDFKISEQITYRDYHRSFELLMGELDLEGHTPHDCRKTFVTLANKYQLNEYAIKLIIGHRIKDITENIYTERSVEWLVSEVEKLPVYD